MHPSKFSKANLTFGVFASFSISTDFFFEFLLSPKKTLFNNCVQLDVGITLRQIIH